MSDAITTESVVIDGAGGGTALVRKVYVPPLQGRSDDYAGFDMRIAQDIGEVLNKHYFGYAWKTYADSHQGVVGFSIPELMGETLHYVIRLAEFSELTEKLIVEKGGELLERMHLPRGIADQAALLFARQNRNKFQFNDKRLQ